jgi:hypothetical protein
MGQYKNLFPGGGNRQETDPDTTSFVLNLEWKALKIALKLGIALACRNARSRSNPGQSKSGRVSWLAQKGAPGVRCSEKIWKKERKLDADRKGQKN